MLYGCVCAALDKKAEDVVILDLRGLSDVADFFIVCHGNSQTQVRAISEGVEMALRNQGVRHYNVEGREACSWVLMDFHDVVVHVFHGTTRAYYALEKLWSDARSLDAGEILAWG
ncbi:MAG: ribosome silencing factor [Nitrospinae bacterium]|nr:ribosome silencing factor [Nitrospinota bacterium]